jgi:hypothetical protein
MFRNNYNNNIIIIIIPKHFVKQTEGNNSVP